MEAITYQNMCEKLVEAIPSLKINYAKELKWWDGKNPGPHNIYGDVLNPYIEELVKFKNQKSDELKLIFEFLEKLATHEDEKVRNVLQATVCEQITGNGLYSHLKKYMGKETLSLTHEIANYWGHPLEKGEGDGSPSREQKGKGTVPQRGQDK